jgi:uncharacterized glyoxalase superfamily protein PhnB
VSIQIIPYIFYRDVPAALEFLARAFGFVETARNPTPRGGMHGEMEFGGHTIMMGQGSDELGLSSVADARGATQGVFIYLDDVDAHYERARAAAAEIEKPPRDLPYGRSYTARDPEGHPWYFTTPPRG